MRHITSTNSLFVSRLLSFLAIVTISAAMSCSTSSAQVLLTIDTSDVSNVVITATGSFAGQASSGKTANDGIDLLSFFSISQAGVTGQFLPNSSLQGGGTGVSYDDLAADNYSTGMPTYLDANLYVDGTALGAGTIENFTTGSAAFTGTWTIDLGSLGISSAALPGNGASGAIISGDAHNPGVEIGRFTVTQTPEPTTASLALLGFAITGVVVLRQRRKAAKV